MNHHTALRLKVTLTLAALSLGAPVALAQAVAPAGPPEAAVNAAATDEASSYSFGLVFGNQLHTSGIEKTISPEALLRGVKDGLAGKALAPEDKQRMVQVMRAGREAVAEHNRAAAREFLAKNGAAPGVTTTASGLQYQVMESGDAKTPAPTMTDHVTVHYRGRLLDGTEFDSSDNHAQAATFGLNGVIKGWREALLLMKPGAKWRVFVPPELGYDLNSPPVIPPGSLLIYDLELLKVEAQPVMKSPAAKAPGHKRPVIKSVVPGTAKP